MFTERLKEIVDLSWLQRTKPNLKTKSGNSRQEGSVGNTIEAGGAAVIEVIMINSAQCTSLGNKD